MHFFFPSLKNQQVPSRIPWYLPMLLIFVLGYHLK